MTMNARDKAESISAHLEAVINHLEAFSTANATPKDYKAIGGAVAYLKFFQKHYEKEMKHDMHMV